MFGVLQMHTVVGRRGGSMCLLSAPPSELASLMLPADSRCSAMPSSAVKDGWSSWSIGAPQIMIALSTRCPF